MLREKDFVRSGDLPTLSSVWFEAHLKAPVFFFLTLFCSRFRELSAQSLGSYLCPSSRFPFTCKNPSSFFGLILFPRSAKIYPPLARLSVFYLNFSTLPSLRPKICLCSPPRLFRVIFFGYPCPYPLFPFHPGTGEETDFFLTASNPVGNGLCFSFPEVPSECSFFGLLPTPGWM